MGNSDNKDNEYEIRDEELNMRDTEINAISYTQLKLQKILLV